MQEPTARIWPSFQQPLVLWLQPAFPSGCPPASATTNPDTSSQVVELQRECEIRPTSPEHVGRKRQYRLYHVGREGWGRKSTSPKKQREQRGTLFSAPRNPSAGNFVCLGLSVISTSVPSPGSPVGRNGDSRSLEGKNIIWAGLIVVAGQWGTGKADVIRHAGQCSFDPVEQQFIPPFHWTEERQGFIPIIQEQGSSLGSMI